jgi:hypothetical protein
MPIVLSLNPFSSNIDPFEFETMTRTVDSEKQIEGNVGSIGSDAGVVPTINKQVEKSLVWKTDLILMPALGKSFVCYIV